MTHGASGPQGRPTISFEFFPPKTPKAALALWTAVERLAPLGPDFVSVTYGAGGTTRDRTLTAIQAIRDRARLDVAGHLTCVGNTRADVLAVADHYAKLGCRRIVALRGDAPDGEAFQAHDDGFQGSCDLIEALAKDGRFQIWVGAYPEPHPEAPDAQADIAHLKSKQDAGAHGALTQFFFDKDSFLRFRDRAVAAGVTMPIVPGILPVENFDRMCNFAGRCGASIPQWMTNAYRNATNEAEHDLLSIAIAAELCDDLMAEGVSHLHLYTMNKPDLPYQVIRALGVEPVPMQIAVTAS